MQRSDFGSGLRELGRWVKLMDFKALAISISNPRSGGFWAEQRRYVWLKAGSFLRSVGGGLVFSADGGRFQFQFSAYEIPIFGRYMPDYGNGVYAGSCKDLWGRMPDFGRAFGVTGWVGFQSSAYALVGWAGRASRGVVLRWCR